MNILGIDPGYEKLGYAIVNDTKMLKMGVIETPGELELPDRLVILEEKLTKLIKVAKPKAIGYEKPYFSGGFHNSSTVQYALGVILLTCAKVKVPLYSFPPQTIKLRASGKGNSSKLAMKRAAKRIYGLKSLLAYPDDAYDAACVAYLVSQDVSLNLDKNV